MCKSHFRSFVTSTASSAAAGTHGSDASSCGDHNRCSNFAASIFGGLMTRSMAMMAMIIFVVWVLPCASGEVALLQKTNGVFRGASSVVDAAAGAGNVLLLSGNPEDRFHNVYLGKESSDDDNSERDSRLSPSSRRLLESEHVNELQASDSITASAGVYAAVQPQAGTEAEAAVQSIVDASDLIARLGFIDDNALIKDEVQPGSESPALKDEDGHEEEEEEEHMPFWTHFANVTGAAVAMLCVSLIGVFLPSLISRLGRKHSPKKQRLVESLGTAFAAGGFWGLAIVHVFLEAVTLLEDGRFGLFIGPHNSFLNGAFPLALVGYISLLCIHNLAVTYIRKNKKYLGGRVQTERERLHMAIMDASVAAFALMIHAFFEGVVAGMRDDALLIWVAALSIMGHKWAESFALTQQMRAHGVPTRPKVLLLGIVLAASPIGAWVGLGIYSTYEEGTVVGVLNSLSAGILIFVAGHCTGDVFGSHDHEHVHTSLHNDRVSPAVECRKADEMSCCSSSVDCDIQHLPGGRVAGSPVLSDSGSCHAHIPYCAVSSPPASDHEQSVSHLQTSAGCNDHVHHHHDRHYHHHRDFKSTPETYDHEAVAATAEVIHSQQPAATQISVCDGHYHFVESDPLDGSFKILFLRIGFLCLGSSLVFSLMIVHMMNSAHDHSLHAH